MPKRKRKMSDEFGAPKFVYRIDSRPPEQIFRDGFASWGTNFDFFSHIMGYTLDSSLPSHLRSIYISTTDSIDAALRFFISKLSFRKSKGEQISQTRWYVYEIRADEGFYSALRTGSRYRELLESNRRTMNAEAIELMERGLSDLFDIFAYQREWFALESIDPSSIRSAFTVDVLETDPRYATMERKTGNVPVTLTSRINDDEQFNENYVDPEEGEEGLEVAASREPFTVDIYFEPDFRLPTASGPSTTPTPPPLGDEVDSYFPPSPPEGDESSIIVPSYVLSTPESVSFDADWDVRTSMSFSCPTPSFSDSEEPGPSTSRRFKRDVDQLGNGFNYCYFTKDELVTRPLGSNAPSIQSKNPIPLEPQKVYLTNSLDKNNRSLYIIGLKENNSNYEVKLNKVTSSEKVGIDLIYDAGLRLSWYSEHLGLGLSMGLNNLNVKDQETILKYKISTMNSEDQQWLFDLVRDNKPTLEESKDGELIFEVNNVAFEDYSIYKKHNDDSLYFRSNSWNNSGYEKLYLIVSPNTTDVSILSPQKPYTSLYDLKMKWMYYGIPYHLIPETGYSAEGEPSEQRFFFDLKTSKILYINDKMNVFNLFNDRNSYAWNYVRWIDGDTSVTKDNRLKWILKTEKLNGPNQNYRQFLSYDRLDYAKVIATGFVWGSVFTEQAGGDERNAIIRFVIDKNADI